MVKRGGEVTGGVPKRGASKRRAGAPKLTVVKRAAPSALPAPPAPPASRRVTIRRADVGEAAAVADVHLASRRDAAPFVPRGTHTAAEVRDWFARIVLVEHEVWVAEIDGRLVGVMVLRGDSMDQLYVLGEHQRRGIGARLLAQAKRVRRVLRLYAFQSNEPARAFYEKHGFQPIAFGDGTGNEEGAPDVLYEWKGVVR